MRTCLLASSSSSPSLAVHVLLLLNAHVGSRVSPLVFLERSRRERRKTKEAAGKQGSDQLDLRSMEREKRARKKLRKIYSLAIPFVPLCLCGALDCFCFSASEAESSIRGISCISSRECIFLRKRRLQLLIGARELERRGSQIRSESGGESVRSNGDK